jgi:hypothetical protein
MGVNTIDGPYVAETAKDFPLAKKTFAELVSVLKQCTVESDITPMISYLNQLTVFCSTANDNDLREIALVVDDGFGYLSLAKLMVSEKVAVSGLIEDFKAALDEAVINGEFIDVDSIWREKIEPMVQDHAEKPDDPLGVFEQMIDQVSSVTNKVIDESKPENKSFQKILSGWYDKQPTPVKVAVVAGSTVAIIAAIYFTAKFVARYFGNDDSDVIISE